MAVEALETHLASAAPLSALAAAVAAERRRIERDLHDGAQQRLVAAGLLLRHLQHELPASPALTEGLDAAVAEIGEAIADLRELGRRCPVDVIVDVTPERVAPAVEVAAYFVVSEAMTNAIKHGGARRIVVRAGLEHGALAVSVGDDGCGGARSAEGTGLAGLRNRVGALGGRLRVISPPGAGTTVAAELPCAA
jgi:signal transduction histidine kinase